jgi:hypothetical protein
LVVEAGTTVEGDTASAIFITRNGRIFAEGSATRPVVFTCSLRNVSGTRFPACWGGIFIAGNAVLNEGQSGMPAAPDIENRNDGGGGNQRAGEGGAADFGGNNDADNSGTLRYVSIRYGGKKVTTNNELNNLTVGACGTGTIIEHIQVHAGTDDGLEFFGGRCNAKWIYATANEDDQVDYSFGYDGDLQYIIIQSNPDTLVAKFDRGFEVDNTETSATYNNTPRTNAQVYNVTYIGPTTGVIMHYRRGAASTIRNVIALRAAVGIEVDDAASCSLMGSSLTFDKIVFLDVTAEHGASSSCSSAEMAAGVLDTESRTYDDELKDPYNLTLPDFRTTGVSAAFSPDTVPTGFGPGTYFGAVAPGVGGNIPWYAGWVTGWQSATMR